MTTSIKAIAFDAYGTLFDVYSVGALGEEMFPGKGAALATLWRDKQITYTQLRTLCDRYADFRQVTGDALDYAGEALGLGMTAEQRDRLMGQYERLSAFSEVPGVLAALKAKNLPLAILSNGTPGMLRTAADAAGISPLLDHLLSVDSVRRFKTAPEAYQLGPDAFGVPAGEILFVSSNGWDVSGATWFGYTTFWVNRTGAPRERLGVAPTAEGRSLEDLPVLDAG